VGESLTKKNPRKEAVGSHGYPAEEEKQKSMDVAMTAGNTVDPARSKDVFLRWEERYRTYGEMTGQLAWVTNPDGEVEEDIPLWRRYTGQSFEKTKGSGWLASIHPDDAERVAQAWKKAVAARTPYDIEYRVLRHDGVYRYFLAHAVPLLMEDGSVREWVGACVDITERTKTEEKNAQLAAIVESSDDAIIGLTLDGMVTSWNRGAEKTYGYRENEIVGMPFSLLVPPGREDELPQILGRIKGGEHIERYETVRRRKDGGDIHMSLIISPIRDRDGKIVAASSIGRDITARKNADEALVTSQLHLSEAMDLARIVYWELDWATETFTFNDAFYASYGTTAEQEGGYQMAAAEYSRRFIHPDDRAMVREAAQRNRSGKELEFSVDLEHRIIRRDGAVRHILTRTRVLRDRNGTITKYYGANQDITERKQAEQEKAALEAHLRHAQKLEAVGTLAAGVAHDFKNILTAVEGFAKLSIKHVPEAGKAKPNLDQICRVVERGKDLVGQILTFSQTGEEELRPIELIPVIRESIRMLQASLHPMTELREDFTSAGAVVLADRTQVQQIIINLATNAAYAIGQGGGILTVALSDFALTAENAPVPDMTPGPYLKLSISDTGTGMDKATVKRVFDRFFTTKKRTGGTGLGLWVVHGIVKKHRGAITVRSAPGVGSTFEVFLPRFVE
jgi:PAS domain S-box-containing protein